MGQITAKGQTVQATVAKYAQYQTNSEMLSMVSRDPRMATLSELFGEAAAKSIDALLMTEAIQRGSIPMRVDELVTASGTYTREQTIDSVANATGNTTTTFVDAGATAANDYFNGAHFAVMYPGSGTPTNYRYGGQISDCTQATNWFTISPAAPAAFDSSTYYRMVVGTGISATVTMTGDAIRFALKMANKQRFYPFPGGYFRCVIGDDVMYDLASDTVWKTMSEYSKPENIEKGFVKRLWGVDFYRTTQPYRESVAGASGGVNTTGVVFCTPLFGMHSLGTVDLAGNASPKIIVKTPGPQTVSEPHNENGSIGYAFYYAAKSLNAAFCINMMSGATGIA